MDRRTFLQVGAAAVATVGVFGVSSANALSPKPDLNIQLSPVDFTGGKPLMACLKARRSTHVLDSAELDLNSIGGLLWAAWGVNREDGKRVIPTARNKQEVMVFAVLADGVWEYLHGRHAIKRVIEGDQRGKFEGAGCVLLYAAPKDDRFAAMHIGAMYQNVGLYCASQGLVNCVKDKNHDALDKELPLPKGWMTYIFQAVARAGK